MLKTYTWNVFQLARANHQDLGVALRMFLNNVSQGRAVNLGAPLDYASLKAQWDMLSEREQEAEIAEMHQLFAFSSGASYHRLAQAFQADDRLAFEKALEE